MSSLAARRWGKGSRAITAGSAIFGDRTEHATGYLAGDSDGQLRYGESRFGESRVWT